MVPHTEDDYDIQNIHITYILTHAYIPTCFNVLRILKEMFSTTSVCI